MRRFIPLMENWNFLYGKDNTSKTVDLPHTWNNLDGQDGGNDYYRGSCIYTKKFNKPDFNEEDEVVYLNFDGVNSSCKVTLNGHEILTHDGGYSTFRTNITNYLKEENELQVVVDNSVSDRVYPQNADFTFYGGIYRDVKLIIVNKTHFDLDFYGAPGIKCDTEIKGDHAIVNVSTFNNEMHDEDVLIELFDRDGKLVASKIGRNAVLELKEYHLWNGVKDPYLYNLKVTILREGKIVDVDSTKVGIRTFRIDPNKGFYLNGEYYPLRGVSRHQDRKAIGNAITNEMMEEDIKMILEVGANCVRLAHYQHNQHFYDLCDEAGLLVWAEIPYISEHMVNGRENTISQMKELISQNYNHPCIMTWGLSNEITIKGKHKKDMLDNHRVLQKLVKDLDPTRPTSLACYAMCTPFHPVTRISDLIGWNLYLGWYVPGMWLNDAFLYLYKMVHPKKPLAYSEYGAEGMPNLHSKHPHRMDNSEEYQCIYHEFMLKFFARHRSLWATYVWNMFDFAADARNQGGEPGMNHKGLVTFDRKLKKDAFYLYKAYWSDESFIHVCGKRFENRTGKSTIVKVYSTLPTLSLYNNGELVATKNGNKVFKFKVKLSEVNEIKVTSGDLSDSCVLHKVDKADPAYKLKKGNSTNWTKEA